MTSNVMNIHALVLRIALLTCASYTGLCQSQIRTHFVNLSTGEQLGNAVGSVLLSSATEDNEFRIRTSEPWLFATSTSAKLPARLTVACDPRGLEPGLHRGVVSVLGTANQLLQYIAVECDVIPSQYLNQLETTRDGKTTITITNTAETPTRVELIFRRAAPTAQQALVSSRWAFPFENRSATDVVYETLAPRATLTLSSKDDATAAKGWAEVRSTQRVLCRGIRRFKLANRDEVNTTVYQDVAAQPTPIFVTFENTTAVRTALVIMNPTDAIVSGTVGIFDSNGLPLGAKTAFEIPSKGIRTLTPDQYVAGFTNLPATGLAVISATNSAPLQAAALRRSADSTALLAGKGSSTGSPTLRGLLFPGGTGEPNARKVLFVNSQLTQERSLVTLHSRSGPDSIESVAFVTVPAVLARATHLRCGPGDSWLHASLPNKISAWATIDRPATGGYGEVIEEASQSVRGSLRWAVEDAQMEVAVSNPGSEAGRVLILLRKEWGQPVELANLQVMPESGIRVDTRKLLPPDEVGVGVLEVVNISGAPLVGSLLRFGPKHSILPSASR